MLNQDSPTTVKSISSDAMSDEICEYIQRELLPSDAKVELKSDDDLLSIEYLDSMQFIRLVQFVEDRFKLVIPPEDLLIDNFQTVRQLSGYLSEQLAKS